MSISTRVLRPPAVNLVLDADQLRMGVEEGCERRLAGLSGRFPPRYGAEQSAVGLWDNDINGACAELAVSLYLGEPWTARGAGPEAVADVGSCFQVRWTPYADAHLNVWKDDKPHHFYVLVTGWDGHYDLRGWMAGAQAKDPGYWRVKGLRTAAFWVPQSAPLNGMELLK